MEYLEALKGFNYDTTLEVHSLLVTVANFRDFLSGKILKGLLQRWEELKMLNKLKPEHQMIFELTYDFEIELG